MSKELHAIKNCPACVEQIEQVEPYEDWTGTDVECSRCFDDKIVCKTCDDKKEG